MRKELPCKGTRIGRGRAVRVCEFVRRAHRLQRQFAECEQARLEIVLRMRHDLLGPLNTLSGFLELLAEERAGPLNATQRVWIADTRTVAERLRGLIEVAGENAPRP